MREGWGWKTNCLKRHYFVDGRSLCRLWWIGEDVDLTQSYDDISENRPVCRKAFYRKKFHQAITFTRRQCGEIAA